MKKRNRTWALAIAAAGLVVTASVPVIAAAPAAAVVRQGTAHDALFGVAFDGDRGVAVGAMGELLESPDAGRSWQDVQPAPTPLALLGVSVRGTHRIAVGQQGLILRKDGDSAWAKVDSGSEQRLLSVAINASGFAVVVGAFGTILVSDDAGANWRRVQIDWSGYVEDAVEPHLLDVIVDDDGVITVAGEYGLILRSPDHGAQWTAVHRGDAALSSIELRSDGIGYAVGQKGTVLTTTDGGNVWTPLATGSEAVLLNVWSAPDGRVVVAGMREMLESRDGGRSFRPRRDGDFATSWYGGLAAPASGGLILVGQSGRILRLDS